MYREGVAKNRHLNIVLRAELYLRTGTYDRPNLAKALAIDAYPRIATQHGDMTCIHDMRYLYLSTWSGKGLLTHFLMKHLERSGNQKKKTRLIAPPGVPLPTGSTLRLGLSTYSFDQAIAYPRMASEYPCSPSL